MKKILSILTIVGFIFIITACRGGQETWEDPFYQWTVEPGEWDPTIGEYRPEERAKLKLWVDNEAWAEELITEYRKLFPEVKVTYENVGSVDTRAKMELDGPAGLGADVFVMPHDHFGQALRSNLLGPIEEYETQVRERIITTSVETVTADQNGVDKIFAFPISGESIAMFYNKAVLQEKGVQLATTWEEILAQAKQYNNINENFFWVGMDVGNAYDMHFVATAHGYQLFGPERKNPDQVNFNSPEMVSALTWMKNVRENVLNVDSSALSGNNIRQAFETGKMAYIIDGPWSIDRYIKADVDFGVMRIPTINVNGTARQPVTFSGNQVAAVSTFSKFPAAARTLANFMASEQGAQVMYRVTSKLPTLKSTENIEGLADNPYLKGISDQMQYSEPMPTIPQMSIFWANAGTMYSNAWNLTLSPAEAAAKAHADYEAARELSQ